MLGPVGNYSTAGWGIAAAVSVKAGPAISVDVSGNYTRGLSKVFTQGLGGSTNVYGTNGNFVANDIVTNGAGAFGVAKAWGVNADVKFQANPALWVALGGTYGQLSYTNNFSTVVIVPGVQGGVGTLKAWGVGAEANWSPVTNLSFDLDVNYVKVNVPNASGFLGRLQIARTF